MSELKLPRLLAAAKEFNIGQDTLIEFLSKKGFPKDDLKPTAKLTEDQYYALQAEFQSDKVAKNKADHVELPKGAAADKKVVAAEPKTAKVVKAAETKEVSDAAVTSVKIEAPEVDAPKVVNKIDLSLIDSSTRPKKTTKKAAEPSAETSKMEDAAKAADGETKSSAKKTKATKEATPAPPEDHSIAPENVHGEITNIQADKLTGPTILGKIDLPINTDTRPKPLSQEEKRVRKRIPVQGGGNRPQGGGQQQQAGGNRAQAGGGYQGNRPQGGGYQGNRPNNRPGQAAGGKRNAPQTAEQKEIDQKAIQDKIKETQAKLSGQGGRGKSLKSKYRRAKREEAAENEQNEISDNKLQVTEFVTVSELANLMD
ncbi:MAG: hypothetical protein ACO3EE_11980, partial [Flavobacteriales bacterium]